jgi:hypothetical protein
MQIKFKKGKARKEKGVALVEAALILPIFLFFIFSTLIVCGQCFYMYTAYYQTFKSLRSISVGPVSPGVSVISSFRSDLEQRLNPYRIAINLSQIKVTTPENTYGLYDSGLQIRPNSFISVEVPVQFMDVKILNFSIPEIKVRSAVQTYDWT